MSSNSKFRLPYLNLWQKALLLLVCAVVIYVLPKFSFIDNYWVGVLSTIGLGAALTLSLNIILGQAGIFNMGHMAFYAIGAYTTAILNTRFGVPILYIMPLAGLAAGLFAFIVAKPIIHLRGDYLLIVTIGIVEIVRIALVNDIGGITGGANGIFGISRPSIFGQRIIRENFYYLIWAMVLITVILFHFLYNSRFGRALSFIKEDDIAAEGCGINVSRYKLIVFSLGAFWAGMAGNLYAAYMNTIAPTSFNFIESVYLFAAVILGGGSIGGAIIGAFLVFGLQEVFRSLAEYRMLIYGLALMIMMIIRPQGLFPPRPRRYNIKPYMSEKLSRAVQQAEAAAKDGQA